MGACLRIPIIQLSGNMTYVSSIVARQQLLSSTTAQVFTIFVTDSSNKLKSHNKIDYGKVDFRVPSMIVIGSEATGVSVEVP